MLFKNFITISATFLTMLSINLFASNPCKGMFGSEGESKPTLTNSKNQKKLEEVEIKEEKNDVLGSVLVRQDNSLFEILPDEPLFCIFRFLRVDDLGRVGQISRHFNKISSSNNLWENVGLENYGDYFSVVDLIENPKQNVIHHYLSVILNTKADAQEIYYFIKKYELQLYSFIPYFKSVLSPHIPDFGVREQIYTLEHKQTENGIRYGKLNLKQVVDNNREIKKLRQERDALLKKAVEESTIRIQTNPYYAHGQTKPPWQRAEYEKTPTWENSIPNKTLLNDAKKVNEGLIAFGDEEALKIKIKQLCAPKSNVASTAMYGDKEFGSDDFLTFLSKDQKHMIKNMDHYLRAYGLKYGELGYKENYKEAVEYIRLHNIPY